MKVFSQFIFSDILAKFPENASEVFNSYKSVGIFVKFAKNHSYIRLSLVVEYWHFEAIAKKTANASATSPSVQALLYRNFFLFVQKAAGLIRKTSFAFNEMHIVNIVFYCQANKRWPSSSDLHAGF